MKWEEYKEEIELIEKQNNVEHDLYNIVYSVLRDSASLKKFSIRNVCDRKRTDGQSEKIFWGIKGFPDFVLIDKSVSGMNCSKDMIYGAVEAKYVGKPILEENGDITQLIGHLLWFNRVIYTNGIEWRVYNNTWGKVGNITEFQNNTYSIKGTEVRKKWEDVDKQLLKDYPIYDLDPAIFVLRDSANKWNKDRWDDLVSFLNSYLITPTNGNL